MASFIALKPVVYCLLYFCCHPRYAQTKERHIDATSLSQQIYSARNSSTIAWDVSYLKIIICLFIVVFFSFLM